MSIAVGLAWYAQSQKDYEKLRADIARLRLTHAEREAIEDAIRCVQYLAEYGEQGRANLPASANTLRRLLERMPWAGE